MDHNLENETFAQRLDQLILGFRSETMNEFIRTKGRLQTLKNETIDSEKAKSAAQLKEKQDEIDELKMNLMQEKKLREEYSLRCEIMAFWSGKGRAIGRERTTQMRSFLALKKYWQFKKHSQIMLNDKARSHRKQFLRRVFQAWHKDFKVAKVKRDEIKFERAVKLELQSISSQY